MAGSAHLLTASSSSTQPPHHNHHQHSASILLQPKPPALYITFNTLTLTVYNVSILQNHSANSGIAEQSVRKINTTLSRWHWIPKEKKKSTEGGSHTLPASSTCTWGVLWLRRKWGGISIDTNYTSDWQQRLALYMEYCPRRNKKKKKPNGHNFRDVNTPLRALYGRMKETFHCIKLLKSKSGMNK